MQKVKHPHDEIIRAWLDGEAAEIWEDDKWFELPRIDDVVSGSWSGIPAFFTDKRYRIKPKVKTATIYVYMNHLGYLFSSMGPLTEEQMAVRSISHIHSHEFTYTEEV